MTQTEKIMKWLRPPGRSITSLQAVLKFRIMRLSERIRELERKGVLIRKESVKNDGVRYVKYSIR